MKKNIISVMLAVSMMVSSFSVLAEPRHGHSARSYSQYSQHAAPRYSSQKHQYQGYGGSRLQYQYRGASVYAAQPYQYRGASGYSGHPSFYRGGHLPATYWNQRSHVNNWHQHSRLYAPPRGYAWYHADDRYVLAAVATGLISAIVLSH